jgi:hypothetical protein
MIGELDLEEKLALAEKLVSELPKSKKVVGSCLEQVLRV